MLYETIKFERLAEKVFLKLLEIKDSDIRILTMMQGKTAVDRGIHIGGAFSAIIPLTALYYSGIMYYDVAQPTREGQDLFVLSKGHAVAALASIYADLGFFPESYLKNSRSYDSFLNGHPGPILPGIHVSTGPLGQGICVAQGFALASQCGKNFDVFALTGDGELQEGIPWEAFIFAGAKKLDNLCVLIDRNNGQLDNPKNLLYPMDHIGKALESFGWDVAIVDATKYEPVIGALRVFKQRMRNGRPRAIICDSRKGQGGFSSFMVGHKVEFTDDFADQEIQQQEKLRAVRIEELGDIIKSTGNDREEKALRDHTTLWAKKMRLNFSMEKGAVFVTSPKRAVKTKSARERSKKIFFSGDKLIALDTGKEYSAQKIISSAMKIFALDPRVVSVDSDLGSTSGLEAGISYVDRRRALNVGIAEAKELRKNNMTHLDIGGNRIVPISVKPCVF
jgi:transketolase N-terminal domain/subunit